MAEQTVPPALSMGKPDYTQLDFPDPPAHRPYVLVNMVSSVDGKVVIEGTEQGLGSTVDQALMRELRVHADVVLNGASTLRASGTSSRVPEALQHMRIDRGKPANPLAAVLSATGRLPLERAFFTADDFDAVIYLADDADPSRAAAVRATGRRVVPVPAAESASHMLRHMREELGAHVLLVEGGPTMNGELLDRGFVDELFLTLGSVAVGGNGTLTAIRGQRDPSIADAHRLDLVSAAVNPATSELHLRYRVADRGAR